jgi:hypothetical protein
MKTLGASLILLTAVSATASGQETPKKEQRELRVLLFADAPTREFQFVRQVLTREPGRVRLHICLQSADEGTEQGIPPIELVKLPLLNVGQKDRPYDLVIAFDPDWSRVSAKHLQALNRWVEADAGGMVYVAGPVHSWRVARPGGQDLSALVGMLPVRLKDIRVGGAAAEREADLPHLVRLTDETSPILQLDAGHKSAADGWDKFFWNEPRAKAVRKTPVRGFFRVFPVEPPNERALVLLNFVNQANQEQPFLIAAPHGKGRVVFVASDELWRLRACEQAYHDQLWWNLAHYATGRTQLAPTSVLRVRSEAVQGDTIPVEARLVDQKGKPIDADARPVMHVMLPGKKPREVEIPLKARSDGDWAGWFDGKLTVSDVGEHALAVEAPGSTALKARLNVKSLFQAHVAEGRLSARQLELGRRSYAWSRSVLEVTRPMADRKADQAARAESKVYQDAIATTIAQTWSARHAKMERALTTLLKTRNPTDLNAALDESEAITKQLAAMRVLLAGADHAKDPDKLLALLEKLTTEESTLEFALDKTRIALADATERCLRLAALEKRLTRDELDEQAKAFADIGKSVQACRVDLKDATKRCQQALRDLQTTGPRPETMRFSAARLQALSESWLADSFDRTLTAVAGLQSNLEKADFQPPMAAKVEEQLAKLEAERIGITTCRVGPMFAELIALEREQAQQSRILVAIRKQLEAEILKQLLDQ